MKNKKILIVEDDHNLGKLIQTFLTAKKYTVVLAKNGQDGFEKFNSNAFDFIILDVMMPVKDGFTLAKEIREIDKKIPFVFLTAKSLKEDKLEGFKTGADDYISKPFSMEELLARINAILRRVNKDTKDENKAIYTFGELTYDFNRRKITIGNKETKLTTKENQLFLILCKNQNQVLERNTTLKAIWGDDSYYNSRSMDVYIAKLRKYIKQIKQLEIINVHGKGFKLIVH